MDAMSSRRIPISFTVRPLDPQPASVQPTVPQPGSQSSVTPVAHHQQPALQAPATASEVQAGQPQTSTEQAAGSTAAAAWPIAGIKRKVPASWQSAPAAKRAPDSGGSSKAANGPAPARTPVASHQRPKHPSPETLASDTSSAGSQYNTDMDSEESAAYRQGKPAVSARGSAKQQVPTIKHIKPLVYC